MVFLRFCHVVLCSPTDLESFLEDEASALAKSISVKAASWHENIETRFSRLLNGCTSLTYLEVMVCRHNFRLPEDFQTFVRCERTIGGDHAEWLTTCTREQADSSWGITIERGRKIRELKCFSLRNRPVMQVRVRRERLTTTEELQDLLRRFLHCDPETFTTDVEADFKSALPGRAPSENDFPEDSVSGDDWI